MTLARRLIHNEYDLQELAEQLDRPIELIERDFALVTVPGLAPDAPSFVEARALLLDALSSERSVIERAGEVGVIALKRYRIESNDARALDGDMTVPFSTYEHARIVSAPFQLRRARRRCG